MTMLVLFLANLTIPQTSPAYVSETSRILLGQWDEHHSYPTSDLVNLKKLALDFKKLVEDFGYGKRKPTNEIEGILAEIGTDLIKNPDDYRIIDEEYLRVSGTPGGIVDRPRPIESRLQKNINVWKYYFVRPVTLDEVDRWYRVPPYILYNTNSKEYIRVATAYGSYQAQYSGKGTYYRDQMMSLSVLPNLVSAPDPYAIHSLIVMADLWNRGKTMNGYYANLITSATSNRLQSNYPREESAALVKAWRRFDSTSLTEGQLGVFTEIMANLKR